MPLCSMGSFFVASLFQHGVHQHDSCDYRAVAVCTHFKFHVACRAVSCSMQHMATSSGAPMEGSSCAANANAEPPADSKAGAATAT
eukprot:6563846-Alexandrium_andersonii.AAC.1